MSRHQKRRIKNAQIIYTRGPYTAIDCQQPIKQEFDIKHFLIFLGNACNGNFVIIRMDKNNPIKLQHNSKTDADYECYIAPK